MEARVHQLEAELCSRGSETEAAPEFLAEDFSEVDVILHPQVRPVVQQKVKHEQPLSPRGIAAGNSAVTDFTIHSPMIPLSYGNWGSSASIAPESRSWVGCCIYGIREQTVSSAWLVKWKC